MCFYLSHPSQFENTERFSVNSFVTGLPASKCKLITDLIAWTVGWKPGTSDSVMKPSVGLCECGEVGEEAGVERGTGGQRDVGMSFPAVIFSRVSSLKVGVMVEGPPGCM